MLRSKKDLAVMILHDQMKRKGRTNTIIFYHEGESDGRHDREFAHFVQRWITEHAVFFLRYPWCPRCNRKALAFFLSRSMSSHLIATTGDCDWRYGLRWASIADPLAKHSKIKPMTTAKQPLIVLYRWRLHPGSEAGFIVAWSRLTERLKECGSLGSRLHRGPDDILYGYAQWPSDEVRLAAFAENLDPDASEQMRAAIAERFPEIQLEPVVDYLEPLASRAG